MFAIRFIHPFEACRWGKVSGESFYTGRRIINSYRLATEGESVSTIANIVVGLIALVHVYIMVLEMFLWDKPAGLRAFGQSQEAATATKVLAANQGL